MTAPPSIAQMIAAIPQPSVVVDENERIVALNTGAEALFGAHVMGRHFVTALRHPALVDAVELCLRDAKAQQTQYPSRARGHDVTYLVDIAKLGEAHVLLCFQDITDLRQADQMRRDFVANVSHELRTPLTTLMGFIETLRGPARNDAAARERFLETMTQEAERMNRLVGDLLSLSRVEGQERERPTERVDIAGLLRTTMRNLHPLAVDNDVTLKVKMPEASMVVLGDADQLQQVFSNLIENAIKYGGQGNTVNIHAQTHPNDPALRAPAARIEVSDQGPGIEAEHIPRLTERFYRADSHRSRDLGGTGLGLAIVKHILNRHRGRLKVTSEPGGGATFTLILPMYVVET